MKQVLALLTKCTTNIVNMNSCYCSFCASSGIVGPHDHFLRTHNGIGGGKVTCPKLLSTECGHCGRTGHTARYCGEARDSIKQNRVSMIKAAHSAMERGDWMPSGKVRQQQRDRGNVRPKEVNLAGRFGALDIESGDESSNSFDGKAKPTWAQITNTNYEHDVCGDDECGSGDELPAFTWGKSTGARWADDA